MRCFRGIALLLGATAIMAAGCSTDATMNDPPGVQADPTDLSLDRAVGPIQVETPGDYREWFQGRLGVFNQVGDGSEVVVETATVENVQGWVVIREVTANDTLEEVRGVGRLDAAGPQDDLVIELEPPLDPGRHVLAAIVYQDAQPLGVFNFPGQDNPVTDQDGDVVRKRFRLTVEDAAG